MAKSTKTTATTTANSTEVKAGVEDAVVIKETRSSSNLAASEVPAETPQTVVVQKTGFLPTMAGGAIAAGLGFAGAWLGFGHDSSTDVSPQIAEQAGQIEALDARVAALPPVPEIPEMPDLAPLEATIEELRTESSTQFSSLNDALTALDTRITDVERAPSEDGGLTEAAITSIERELDGLREEIATQQTSMQEMTASAAADLEAARAQTTAIEQEAREAAEAAQEEAQAALAVAAVAEVRIAMESGEPFTEALTNLEGMGVAVPEALTAVAEEGLPQQSDLTGAFPDLARAALSTARAEGVDAPEEGGGGLGSFLSSQFNVRSVEPREGDDVDAVLSRAEAAARGGDLDAAMAEVSALPHPVKATFSDWLVTAQARNDALAAASSLDSSVSN